MKPALLALALVASLAPALPATAVTPVADAAAPGGGVPQTGLKKIPLTIVTASGKHRYTVEVAATPAQQEIGMMYRRSMAANTGMLFPFSTSRTLNFWMENTYVPLDLVFIDSDGVVVSVAAEAQPLSRALISSGLPARAVLELKGGEAARIGLRPGDRLRYTLPG